MFFSGISPFVVLLSTAVQGLAYPQDVSPSLIPRQDELGDWCNPNCEFLCTKYHRHTINIDGPSNSQLSHSKRLSVKYDGNEVCPEAFHECSGSDSCDFTFQCNEGWSFKVFNSPIAGPWKFELTGNEGPFYIPDDMPQLGEIPADDIECDAWGCGGGVNPMTCHNCLAHYEIIAFTAEKTCDLPEGWKN